MRKLSYRCWQRLALGGKQVAVATSLMVALAAGTACAQTGGVVFVDDIQQQAAMAARRTATPTTPQSRSPYAVGSRVASPSAQSRFPQPTVQHLADSATPTQEKKSWAAGLKKTVGGWFGGGDKAQETSSQLSNTPVASRPSSPGMPQPESLASARRSTTATPSRNLANAGQSSPASLASRSGGLQQRTMAEKNQPRGLLQLWGSSPAADETAATTKSQPGRNMPAQQPVEVAQRGGAAPAPTDSWAGKLMSPLGIGRTLEPPQTQRQTPSPAADEMVAFVSDRESAPSKSPRQSNMPLAAAKSSNLPAGPMPALLAAPAASTDRVLAEARAQQQSANATKKNSPLPAAKQPEQYASTVTPRASGPQEIVNHHATAASPTRLNGSPMRQAPRSQPKLAVVSGPQGSPVGMPANPVQPSAPEPAKPSAKAIELLTQANDLSATAASEDEYTTVVQICRQVLAIDDAPVSVEYSHELASWALNRRGELKTDEGRTKEALLDFEDALQLDSTRWRAVHNRGLLAAQAGRFADAFDDFNRTIEMNPKFAKAYSNRAALYVQAGKLDQASEDYHQAISLDPDLAVAHKGRGRVCHMLGQFDLALQHLDAAALLAPDDARIVNNRGDLLMDMGRYRAAMRDYQKAIELDDSLAVAYRNLAWLEATCPDKECRDAHQALANAKRALELCNEPGDLEFDTLAAAQAAAGDFQSAQSTMAKAIELAPERDRENYEWRRKLYERGEPYITEPASSIQQASYAN